MPKTKQIGVRFDQNLWDKFEKMGMPTAQKKLNFLEKWYIDNIEKVVAFNNLPEQKEKIIQEREGIESENLKSDIQQESMMEKYLRLKSENSKK